MASDNLFWEASEWNRDRNFVERRREMVLSRREIESEALRDTLALRPLSSEHSCHPFTYLRSCALFSQGFSPFTHGFLQWERHIHTITLMTLFTRLMGECNHSHAHSQFTMNGSSRISSECSSIHVSVGDSQPRRRSLKTNRQATLKRGANDIAFRGFIPITISLERSISTFFGSHANAFTDHSNHIHSEC